MLRAILLILAVWQACVASAYGQEPDQPQQTAKRELSLPLTGTAEDRQAAIWLGPDAEKCARFEPAGLRINLPAGYPGERPQTGMSVPIAVQGDFEVTVRFEILEEPEGPEAGKRGTKVTLGAVLDTGDLVRLARRKHAQEGIQFSTWTKIGNKGPFSAFVTTAKTGRLRLVRTGAVISYYAAEGDAAEFKLLDERPFSKADLAEIQIAGSTGGPQAALDARFRDLRIRSGGLAELASSRPTPWGNLPLLGLVIALMAALATGRWLYVRRRRDKTSLVIHCAGCGKDLRTRPELAGKKVKCPHCGAIMT